MARAREAGVGLSPSHRDPRGATRIVASSEAMRQAVQQVEFVAPTQATVLLLGETGVGKEVLAQAIHDLSPRSHREMVRLSCAALPAELIENELFGRERGAYTDAVTQQIGRFEAAHRSTLFLDEIGDLPVAMQVKLLRVLQERVIERLGSPRPIKVDVRIIAATNRNLEEAVANHTFREDLFYRLNVFPIVVPPLRERTEDIPELVSEFVAELSQSFGRRFTSVSEGSIRALAAYHWPGNVRELRNIVERAIIAGRGPQLIVPTPEPALSPSTVSPALQDLRYEHTRRAYNPGAPLGERARASELRLHRDVPPPARHFQYP